MCERPQTSGERSELARESARISGPGIPARPSGDEEAWCAAAAAAAHVFVDAGALSDAIEVGGEAGHHLQRVRRLRAGETVTVADSTGRWRPYAVVATGAGRLALEATGALRMDPDLAPAVTVAVALTKGGIDDVVARCTELGVDRIEPVRARRSVVRWDDARAGAAVDRMRTVAREAAAQCRRARVPEVAAVAPVASLAGRPGLCLADRAGAAAAALPAPGPEGWTVLVGPEGGFDAEDLAGLDLAAAGGSIPRLAVGPYVLRAGTAPVAAVAALRSLGSPGGRAPGG
jgi:16S rRNA (uracil1498-N3)-methyltransferase